MKYRLLFLIVILVSGACNNFKFNPNEPGPISRDSGPELRIHPNVGSPDYKRMFTNPEEWTEARSRISVFQFHHGNTFSADRYCTTCTTPDGGTNTYQDFVAVGAFRKLSEWGIPISIEMGSLKHFNCEDPENGMPGTLRQAMESISNVKAAGGRVIDVSMDEPFMGGMLRVPWDGVNISGCEYTPERSAQIIIDYWIRPLQQAHPDVEVGLTEAYPLFNSDQLIRNIEALEKNGYKLPFLHIDYDRYALIREGQNFVTDMRKLQQFLRSHGIKFGIVLWGGGLSTQNWFNDTEAMATDWRNALGNSPDRIIVENWEKAGNSYQGPNGIIDPHYYPENLPENVHGTMTYMVNHMSYFFR